MQCVSQVDLVTPRNDGTGRPPWANSVTCCGCCTSAAPTASASGTFCVRRRCLAGGTPEVPRCVPEVDPVSCCGCSTCGPDWSVYGLTMKACVTCWSMPLTKLEASSRLVFYRPGFPNGAFRRVHYSTGNSEETFRGLTCRLASGLPYGSTREAGRASAPNHLAGESTMKMTANESKLSTGPVSEHHFDVDGRPQPQ